MRTVDELIAEAPVFAGLGAGRLAFIAGCGRLGHAPAGAYLFREGDPADGFYLLRAGMLALEVAAPGREPLTVETFHAGDVVGWSWLFPPYRWQFDGRAVEALRLVAFDGVCLRGKCEADHELGYELMRRFAGAAVERLQATRRQLLDVYAHPVGG